MKKLQLFGTVLLLSVVCWSLAGCSTPPQTIHIGSSSTAGPRFHDQAAVNAVLQFASWDYTFLVQPRYSENGFLQQVRRDNISQVFTRMNVPRGTAVVVVGWTYNGDVLNQLVADWKSILTGCGFQRVVILRAKPGDRLNGSVIIDDSTLHISSAQSASRGG
jgi:hypothetical protein